MSALSELYKTDFHAWTLKAAELIRQHRLDFDFYPDKP
jgi:hypothetical protein